jgi:hypothetical protein
MTPTHVLEANAAIAATIASGIRSVFCYCPTPRIDSWNPLVMNHDLLAGWVMSSLERLAAASPFGDGRIELGFAFDGFFLPKETVISLFQKVKALGIKVITTHVVRGVVFGPSLPASLPQTSPADPLSRSRSGFHPRVTEELRAPRFLHPIRALLEPVP